MFIGHFAIALGAKKLKPELSLGTLFLATQFLDLLWPVLLIAGIEIVRVEPGITVVTPLNIAYLNNIYGPPPPDDPVLIASVTLSMWLLVFWAYWVDGHRDIR